VPEKLNRTFAYQINVADYKSYCSATKVIQEIKLRDFQIKINNSILVTKTFLHKINRADNDRCSYCNHEPETINHLFLQCPNIQRFKLDVKNWLRNDCDYNFSFLEKDFIFSFDKKNKIASFVYLLIKYFIYKTKFKVDNTVYLTTNGFKVYLKQKLISKKFIAKLNSQLEQFEEYDKLLQKL
jgi:hypothetical protein